MRPLRIRTLMIVVAVVGLVMGCAVGLSSLRRASAYYQTKTAIHENDKRAILARLSSRELDLATHPETASLKELVLLGRLVAYHDSQARRYAQAVGRPWETVSDEPSPPSLNTLSSGCAEEMITLAAGRTLPWLDLSRCGATDASLAPLRPCAFLRSLDLSRNQITDAGLSHLAGLRDLDILNLANNQITDAGLVSLEGLTKLRELDLSHSSVTTAGIGKLARALPNTRISHAERLPEYLRVSRLVNQP
jgi:Leucine-rich repeat (LRR) protein